MYISDWLIKPPSLRVEDGTQKRVCKAIYSFFECKIWMDGKGHVSWKIPFEIGISLDSSLFSNFPRFEIIICRECEWVACRKRVGLQTSYRAINLVIERGWISRLKGDSRDRGASASSYVSGACRYRNSVNYITRWPQPQRWTASVRSHSDEALALTARPGTLAINGGGGT